MATFSVLSLVFIFLTIPHFFLTWAYTFVWIQSFHQCETSVFASLSSSQTLLLPTHFISLSLHNGNVKWSDLIDHSTYLDSSKAALRVHKNFAYFLINYLTLLTSLCYLIHSLFFLICLLVTWFFIYVFAQLIPLSSSSATHSLTERPTLGILIVFTVIIVFLTNDGLILKNGNRDRDWSQPIPILVGIIPADPARCIWFGLLI